MKNLLGKNKTVVLIFSVFSLGLFFYFVRQMEWAKIAEVVTNIDYGLVALGVLVLFSSQLFKAIRFKGLIYSGNISVFSLLKVVVWHNLSNHLLPFKSGELAYPLILKKNHKIGYTESIPTLAIARFFDFSVMFFLFILVTQLNFANRQVFGGYFRGSILLFVLLLIIYFSILNNRQVLNFLINKFPSRSSDQGLKKLLLNKTRAVLVSFLKIKEYRKVGYVFLGTVLFWVLNLLSQYLLILSLGITSLHFYQVFLVTIIINIAMFLPISALAEFGVIEGAYIFSLLYFGVERGLAINSAVAFHLLIIVSSFLFFVIFFAKNILDKEE